MNKLEQAARQALEALEELHYSSGTVVAAKMYESATASLRDALAEQAEQEPVAWHHPQCEGQCIACLIEKAVQDAYGTQGRDYMLRHINAAPVRTKDLTDEEEYELAKSSVGKSRHWLVAAAIAAYKEKNK